MTLQGEMDTFVLLFNRWPSCFCPYQENLWWQLSLPSRAYSVSKNVLCYGTASVAKITCTMSQAGNVWRTVSGKVIKEDHILQSMPNVILSLHLLCERNTTNSFWMPYISILYLGALLRIFSVNSAVHWLVLKRWHFCTLSLEKLASWQHQARWVKKGSIFRFWGS